MLELDTTQNKRDEAVLQMLHQYGAATSMQLTEWLNLTYEPRPISLRIVQSSLLRLQKRKLILKKKTALTRPFAYGLSLGGARLLNTKIGTWDKQVATSAAKMSPMLSAHRSACTDVLLFAMKNMKARTGKVPRVVTDRELATRRFPLTIEEKIPDGLLVRYDRGDGVYLLTWIEVENCFRSNDDMTRLANWLATLIRLHPQHDIGFAIDPRGKMHVTGITFILTSRHARRFTSRLTARLAEALYKYGLPGENIVKELIEEDKIEIVDWRPKADKK